MGDDLEKILRKGILLFVLYFNLTLIREGRRGIIGDSRGAIRFMYEGHIDKAKVVGSRVGGRDGWGERSVVG